MSKKRRKLKKEKNISGYAVGHLLIYQNMKKQRPNCKYYKYKPYSMIDAWVRGRTTSTSRRRNDPQEQLQADRRRMRSSRSAIQVTRTALTRAKEL